MKQATEILSDDDAAMLIADTMAAHCGLDMWHQAIEIHKALLHHYRPQCTGCAVAEGTHKPAGALHQIQEAPEHPAQGVPAPAAPMVLPVALGLSPVERQALEHLCAVALAAYRVTDDSPYDGDGTVPVEHSDMDALISAMDRLDSLPDDQPGYVMEPAAKAAWALRRLLDAAPQAPAAPVVLDDRWKVKLLDGRALLRDEMGFGDHPELPILDEGMKPEQFFAALGIEVRHTMAEDDLEWEMLDEMSEAGNWSAWAPKPPNGDSWKLVSIFDTEDGQAAWWMRELDANAAQEAPAPVLYVSKEQINNHRDHADTEAGRYLPCRITPAGKFTTPLYAAPQPQAEDAPDAELLTFLHEQCIDLRCFTTSDGEDVGWRTVQHHMGEPRGRVASEVYSDDPRRAIREAMARIERDPHCTGPLHLEDDAAIAAQGEA